MRLLAATILILATAPAWADDAPRHIVSFNLCADQLVLALADREQIAGLSPYAADPALSVVAEAARKFPRLDWQAEATIALAPDLVLVGPNDRPVTRRMLEAQGVRIVEIGLVTSISAAVAQIRSTSILLGKPGRGEKLVFDLLIARDRLKSVPRLSYRTGLVIERGGYTQGPASIASALVAEAGFVPPRGSPLGYGGFLSLERLVMLRPDLLFVKDPPAQPNDQGAVLFTHPALEALYPPGRRIALPTRLTMCGGPALVAAFDYLADVLTRMAAAPK